MSVKIRLKRMGARKRPFYRFVAADSRRARDGRFIEILGWYNPLEKPARVQINEEKTYGWLKNGAEPSETVLALFRQIGLWKKWEMIKKGEDPSEIKITDRIKEHPKKRKGKKAVARAEAATAEAEAPAEVEAPAEEAAEGEAES